VSDGAPDLMLVLGGGGVAGIAWHTGILRGLADAGVDVTGADLVIGTSAGSTVAAKLGAGRPIGELFDRQVDPTTLDSELSPPVSMAELIERLTPIFTGPFDDAERRRRLGVLALATETVGEDVRRAVFTGRLVGTAWPDRRIMVVAVDAVTGDRRVFDATSGVDLIDAVAASSAVPGVWPPVTLQGRRYIDGGVWSATNADLAAGSGRVLVLVPLSDDALGAEGAELEGQDRNEILRPDAASLEAFGADVLDPAVRAPSARAGLTQGVAEADRIRALLAD